MHLPVPRKVPILRATECSRENTSLETSWDSGVRNCAKLDYVFWGDQAGQGSQSGMIESEVWI